MIALDIRPTLGTMALLLSTGFAFAGCAAEAEPAAQELVTTAESALSAGCAPDVPAALAVAAGNRVAFRFKGVGSQIYACNVTATGYGWVFQAPEADLLRPNGRIAGSHYAGPTWEALDGSTVVGTKIAAVTVDPTAIPWLLLSGSAHSGDGMMSKVTFIQRLNTQGGLAPDASTCDAARVGTTANVPYAASYVFYTAVPTR